MNNNVSYKSTILACYSGNFAQAIVINFTAVIFIPLREQFGFTYTQFGVLVLANFITQVLADVLCSKPVDKYGFRPFAVIANILCTIGFILFAAAPVLFKGNEYLGFFIATLVFSGAGGLLELILSPLIDAIPTDEKYKAMSVLHSFYCWGQVAVVVVTTIFLFAFGNSSWVYIVLGWAVIPFINLIVFIKVPIPPKPHISTIMKIRKLLVNPIFILAFFAILFGGASEIAMSQWSSSFMDKGLALPKIVGDVFGMCGFAVMMGTGRIIYAKYASRLNLNNLMIYGALTAIVCYIIVAISPYNWLSILACVVTGLCICLLWPGTLLVASEKLPMAGASMFALLAAGGDIGASVGPWLTGVVTDFTTKALPTGMLALSAEQVGLRVGILVGAIFPLGTVILHLILKKKS